MTDNFPIKLGDSFISSLCALEPGWTFHLCSSDILFQSTVKELPFFWLAFELFCFSLIQTRTAVIGLEEEKPAWFLICG